MKKIAFLVEEDFCSRVFSVKNYITTLKQLLSEKYFVDYIIFTLCPSGTLFYRLSLIDEEKDCKTEEIVLEKNAIRKFTFKKLGKKKAASKRICDMYTFQFLGRDLAFENYDVCVIPNPLAIEHHIKIDAKKIIGIPHDFIPGIYSLTNRGRDFYWANRHYAGFKFFNSECDRILCNSEDTASRYKEFFPEVPQEKIDFLPPFAPYEFKNVQFGESDKKENAVSLAAPFDLRKGLKKIPSLINPCANVIDTLYVFGARRCPESDFNEFFKKIDVKKIVYYPEISYKDLIELYKKCKVLLFPSLEEGLGIPIIEAQVCGCRVVTTNASPMKDLLVEGSEVLSGGKGDFSLIGKMLGEDFDYAGLSRRAKKKFSCEKALEKIIGC